MFASRIEAGYLLADRLTALNTQADLVLGIPRGGVVVAAEIAKRLRLPLDALVVKKLGAPNNPELAIGAITLDGIQYLDESLATTVGLDKKTIAQEVENKQRELAERNRLLRNERPPLDVENKAVILVDDGIATGATVFAAIRYLKNKHVRHILLALPVGPQTTVDKLIKLVDQCVILEKPVDFQAVGQFYQDFQEVTDAEVKKILKENKR